MSAIKVKNLSKYYQVYEKESGVRGSLKSIFQRKYKDVKAVNDISFEIEEGELVGFIGPNGAGKTTTLKVLSGLLYPTSGKISILGFTPFERKTVYLKQISLVMGQKNQLWWDLPVRESLNLQKEIYEIEDKKYKDIVGELSSILEIEPFLNIQVRKLSLGQRMKSELLISLLHTPKVLFLDEPTIGLDVVAQKNIRDFIREYNRKYNSTIILTSHYMEDVKELCKRIIVIDKGKIVYDGSLQKVVEEFASLKLIEVKFESEVVREALDNIGQIEEYKGVYARIGIRREETAKKVGELINNFPVKDLTIEELPIEEVIREMFRRE